MTEVCLCDTSAKLYCPEHEMDGPELRGRAYVELAQLYSGAADRVRQLEFIQRDFHNIEDIARIRDLEATLRTLRPYIQNITLRAVIDEVLPPKFKEKPMT